MEATLTTQQQQVNDLFTSAAFQAFMSSMVPVGEPAALLGGAANSSASSTSNNVSNAATTSVISNIINDASIAQSNSTTNSTAATTAIPTSFQIPAPTPTTPLVIQTSNGSSVNLIAPTTPNLSATLHFNNNVGLLTSPVSANGSNVITNVTQQVTSIIPPQLRLYKNREHWSDVPVTGNNNIGHFYYSSNSGQVS
jgi:hypothetical protein